MHSLTLLFVYLYLLRHATCFSNLFTINLLMVIVMVVFPFSIENNYLFSPPFNIFQSSFAKNKFDQKFKIPLWKYFLSQFSSATTRRPATTTRRSSPRLNTTPNLKTQLACVNRCRQIAGNNVRTCTDRCNADQNSF